MSETTIVAGDHSHVTGTLVFRVDRFNDAMRRLGHTTLFARAEAAGIARMTLIRWEHPEKYGPIRRTPALAHQVAEVAGLTVDQLFVRAAAMPRAVA